jgi:hypothetical protein
MSPRAASRLENLGFGHVFDYAAGRADWGSAGLPLEGVNGRETRAGAHLRTDVPTCRLDDRLEEVCKRLDELGWDTCFVINEERVVLGRIGRRAIRTREDVTAEEAMSTGRARSGPARGSNRWSTGCRTRS